MIRQALASRGLKIDRLADKQSVMDLIVSLHPVQTEHEMVRLGGNQDGGYLLPDDLENLTACFSPGVGDLHQFEQDCLDRGIKTFMADASVEAPQGLKGDFCFRKCFIGPVSRGDYITLNSWLEQSISDEDGDLLLEMDIEGSEFLSLLATHESVLKRFRIMAIEFHNLDQLWDSRFLHVARLCFEKLLVTHACVHIHPNNNRDVMSTQGVAIPPTMEFTFFRRDRFTQNSPVTCFPNALDQPNNRRKPDVVLPPIWHY